MARFVKDMTRDEIIKCIETMDNRFVLSAKDKHSLKVAISAIKAMPWDHFHKTLPPEKDVKLAPMSKEADTPPFYTPKAEFEKVHKSKILCPKCEYEESPFMPCNQCDDLGSQFKEKTNG